MLLGVSGLYYFYYYCCCLFHCWSLLLPAAHHSLTAPAATACLLQRRTYWLIQASAAAGPGENSCVLTHYLSVPSLAADPDVTTNNTGPDIPTTQHGTRSCPLSSCSMQLEEEESPPSRSPRAGRGSGGGARWPPRPSSASAPVSGSLHHLRMASLDTAPLPAPNSMYGDCGDLAMSVEASAADGNDVTNDASGGSSRWTRRGAELLALLTIGHPSEGNGRVSEAYRNLWSIWGASKSSGDPAVLEDSSQQPVTRRGCSSPPGARASGGPLHVSNQMLGAPSYSQQPLGHCANPYGHQGGDAWGSSGVPPNQQQRQEWQAAWRSIITHQNTCPPRQQQAAGWGDIASGQPGSGSALRSGMMTHQPGGMMTHQPGDSLAGMRTHQPGGQPASWPEWSAVASQGFSSTWPLGPPAPPHPLSAPDFLWQSSSTNTNPRGSSACKSAGPQTAVLQPPVQDRLQRSTGWVAEHTPWMTDTTPIQPAQLQLRATPPSATLLQPHQPSLLQPQQLPDADAALSEPSCWPWNLDVGGSDISRNTW